MNLRAVRPGDTSHLAFCVWYRPHGDLPRPAQDDPIAQDVFRRQLFHDDRRGPSGSSRLVPAQGAPVVTAPSFGTPPTSHVIAPGAQRRGGGGGRGNRRRVRSAVVRARVQGREGIVPRRAPPDRQRARRVDGHRGPDGRVVRTPRPGPGARPSHGHVVVQGHLAGHRADVRGGGCGALRPAAGF